MPSSDTGVTVATMGQTERVLQRVADAEGTEPSELDEPLYEVIDPDALERLFDSSEDGPSRDSGELRFPYHGYEVTVRANGDVSVRDLAVTVGSAVDPE
jgi:hypothetical protein